MFSSGGVDREGGTASSGEGGRAAKGEWGMEEFDLENAKGAGDKGRYEST